MALIKCTECGKEFSDRAAACPNCGCPTDIILEDIEKEKSIQQKKIVASYDIGDYKFEIDSKMDYRIRLISDFCQKRDQIKILAGKMYDEFGNIDNVIEQMPQSFSIILTCALFSNMTTSKKEMETIRKIGTKDNRNLSENNILTFLDNFYDGDQFYNYADTFSSKKSDSEMYVYATDTDALLNQINALYCSINPYPWVDVLEDNTVAEEEPDEEPNKKPNEGPDDTIMKQLLSLLVYTNYCGNTTVQSDYELFSKDMHDFFVYNDNFSEQLISFIA